MTKTAIETALDEELSEHLGYDRHDPSGYGNGNSRNGTRSKTGLTCSCGSMAVDVPRDQAGTFEPHIVKKRQRRLTDVDEVILSLHARGLTTGEISAHFADIYGAAVSKDTISRITDRVVEETTAWHTRPLGARVRRDGQVGPRPIYATIGVDLAGHRDVLGMWAAESPNLRHPPDRRPVPLRRPPAPRCHRQSHQTDLHHGQRRSRRSSFGRVRR